MWKQAQYLQMKEHSVLSLHKYPSQGVRMKKKKDQEAWTGSPVLSVCLRPPPPQHVLAPAATGDMITHLLMQPCYLTALCGFERFNQPVASQGSYRSSSLKCNAVSRELPNQPTYLATHAYEAGYMDL